MNASAAPLANTGGDVHPRPHPHRGRIAAEAERVGAFLGARVVLRSTAPGEQLYPAKGASRPRRTKRTWMSTQPHLDKAAHSRSSTLCATAGRAARIGR